LTRIGLGVLLLLVVLGALAARYATQRAEHQRLRELDATRGPVAAPKRFAPTALPTLPPALACVRGVVFDHRAPVGGMQVSLSDAPFSVSADCPCPRPSTFCGCREGLAQVPQLPRAGLVEAVKSAITDDAGRFEVCGLEGTGARLIWGEHLDGRLAMPRSEQGLMIKPGETAELQVVLPVRVRGLVRSGQTPVPNATVLAFTTPAVTVRTFTTDARGQFEALLPPGTADFVVSAAGFAAQRIDQYFSPQQVLVLQLRAESELTVRALFEGRPVAGAEVTLPSEVPVLTDGQGVARFPLRVGAHLLVTVTKGELIGTSSVNVLEGQPRRIDVALKKGVRVRGVVTDEAGQPRVARVRGFGRGKPTPTDEQGRFTSELLLPSTDIHPTASVEGCADSEYKEVRLGERDLEVTLKVTCVESANGVVLDAEGKPIEGAAVFLDGPDHTEHAVTDATGTFRFHQPSAMYQLKVTHERYRTLEQPLQLPAKDVTIVLDAGGSIAGKVVDGQGNGLAGVAVTVVPAVLDALLSEVEGGNTSAMTDSEGEFIVTGLLAGRLVVSATADSLGTAVSDALLLQPGEHREGLVLKLDERIDLSGTVMDEQRRPIPGARVSWDPADEKSALMGVLMDAVAGHVDQVMRFMPSPSVSDAEGRYTLRGLPVSKVKLSVSANGFVRQEQQASRGSTLDFSLIKEGGRARGRVVDEGGHPLERFSVDGTTFTPDDGRFEVELFSNEDSISVVAQGFTRQSLHIELKEPVKELGDVVMKKGRALRIEARGPDGKPLAEVRVAAAQSVDGDSCDTKADGTCVIEPLLDVETLVKAVKDGFTPVSLTLPPGKFEQVLTLNLTAAGGRITGVAFAAPGQPAAARNLFVAGAVMKGVLTEADGKFSAEGLPEGPYCVSLESKTVRGLEWAVTTQASATPAPMQVGPVAQGGVVKGARALPGRLVLVKGAAGPVAVKKVLEGSASNLCESLSASVITTITTGNFQVEGLPPGRWSVFHVSFSQMDDEGDLQAVAIDLLPGETKSIP
jgi:hypothetical protein